MSNRTIIAGRAPHVTIENVGGVLSVVGWEGEDLLIKADEDETRFSQDNDGVVISCSGDLTLRMPRMAMVQIQNVSGDMAIRGITGDLSIINVHGDASLRDISNVTIDSVQSDISLRAVHGNISINKITGDASIREIQGNVTLESIADDLALRDLRGNLHANIGGDVVMSLDPEPGNEYIVHAGDDVMLILPPNANADLEMNADDIYLDWLGIPYEEEVTTRSVRLGSGGAKIHISAGGELRVGNQEKAQQSPEEFGNFAGMMYDWGDFGKQLGARISRRVEEATRHTTNHADRVARRAEDKRRSKAVRGRASLNRWDWSIASNSGTPSMQREPVSEEERMQILKMLAEKKITAEEADKLLETLDEG